MGNNVRLSRSPLAGVKILKAKPQDCKELFPKLRAADLKEAVDGYGVTADKLLKQSLKNSDKTYVVKFDGKVEMMFGVYSPPGWGNLRNIWFVSSNKILEVPRKFHEQSIVWIKELLEGRTGYNIVSLHNTVHLKWLVSIGSMIGKPERNELGNMFVPVFLEPENLHLCASSSPPQ